jgi:hypothetical protein
MTPAAMQRIHELRAKILNGSATKEDEIEAIKLIREDRRSSAEAAAAPKSKKASSAAKIAQLDLNSVLDNF